MKLTKLRAVGPTMVDFPLEYAEPDGPYVLKGADGLNPVAVDVLLNGKTLPQAREIVLLVGLQPAYDTGQTAEELRTELYGLMTPRNKTLMELQFIDDGTVKAYIQGQVKNMEAGLFSADPEVQITIGCVGATKSYLLAPTLTTQIPTPVSDGAGNVTVELTNPGTAPSGFKIGMQFTEATDLTTGVVITDNVVGGQWMKVNKAFTIGERLIIDTREGSKGIWSVAAAGGSPIVRINEFDYNSDWMTLHADDNVLNINVPFTWYDNGVQWTPAYWGV